jgi:UDP-N-acetylglucosamine 2-epimerase (non-hydrolysing)
MTVTIVAGARPNFMKIAPIIHDIQRKQDLGKNITFRLVHTGQHYDKNLSDRFFEELNIPKPHVNFEVKSGTQAEQTAAIMVAFEKDLEQNPSNLVLVVGDVTSTMACAIVAKKAGVDVAHVEAGIRSGDLSMPEEINRMVTDSITDWFFTTSTYANNNLKKSGISNNRIFHVGNTMIDTLLKHINNLKQPKIWDNLNLNPQQYFVLTLHRPSNVDETVQLQQLISLICTLSNGLPVIFPVHPRTKKMLINTHITHSNLHFVEPLGYLEFNYLVKNAFAVLTDSGGITEETTVMNVPCITFRENTERPETCEIGTNELVGSNTEKITKAFQTLFEGKWKQGQTPEFWDGKTAERIIDILLQLYD